MAAAGDIACEPDREAAGAICAQQIVSDAILADKAIDFVLTLGDSQYNSGTLAEYRGSYDKTWGRFKRKTRPVPGNHDYNTPGAAGYFDYFGSAAGERDKGYYSFDIGAWHFVALNSERDLEESGPQVAWLEADLAAHPNRCVAGFWHRPRWSSGEEHGDSDSVAAFVQALYDAGADLILSGHEHNYERFHPLNPSGARDDARGIVQVVAGLGGRSQYDLSGRDTTVAKDDTTYGYLRMVLHADSADMTYVPAVGAFRDSFRLICH